MSIDLSSLLGLVSSIMHLRVIGLSRGRELGASGTEEGLEERVDIGLGHVVAARLVEHLHETPTTQYILIWLSNIVIDMD